MEPPVGRDCGGQLGGWDSDFFLDLSEYYSRNQVFSLTSGISPGLKKKKKELSNRKPTTKSKRT